MPFPSNPVDRQIAIVNNTSYIYSNAKTAWQVNQLTGSAIADTVSYANLTVETNIILPSNTNKPNTNVATGTLHFDSTYGNLEVYYANAWVNIGSFSIPNTAVIASNATVTTSGAYTLTAFTTSGSIILPVAKTADVLVVGGGGPGGYNYGAGGGGGGLIWQTGQTLAAGTYTVTVGAGGTNGGGGTSPANGSSSSFGSVYTALGGGYGAPTSGAGTLYIGGSGGSGGGGYAGYAGGAALQPSQSGLNVGFGYPGVTSNAGAVGGGGAGASPVGTNDTTKSQGGVGKLITGFETYGTDASNSTAPTSGKGYFAAGGGGTLVVQSGGSAGGGGYYNAGVSYAGLANTGGGGGGGFPLAAGGSGIVIIRYLT